MKKVIIACDSFKGTMSAGEVCDIVGSALAERYADIEIVKIPVADGGEGTVEAYLSAFNGLRKECSVRSPLMREVTAFWGLLPGSRAVIECAQASGITVDGELDALKATTYGTGQLISAALDNNVSEIVIGLGGSATTDGGTGLAAALGARFLDKDGEPLPPGGESLLKLDRIDLSAVDKRLAKTKITVLCDVTNPLYGENGAAYVYSPQKGADQEQVVILDEALRRLSAVCESQGIGSGLAEVSGAGAAGGTGFGLMAFAGAVLKRGIDTILDMTDFSAQSKTADLVITGEGKLDSQSLCGKVPAGVAARSKAGRTVAVTGVLATDMKAVLEAGICEVYETDPLHRPFEQVKGSCREDLFAASLKIEV